MVLLRTRTRRRGLDAPFPPGLPARLSRAHPLLDDDALALVEQGLRQWFAVCQRAEGEPLAMPSVVVDDLWHELIVHTQAYERYCRGAFGRFLHHTPEESMPLRAAEANRGSRMRRTYELARELEGADLPLLFRVDRLLRVAHGRAYVADCGSGVCAPPDGATCLAHLPRPPQPRRSGWGGTAAYSQVRLVQRRRWWRQLGGRRRRLGRRGQRRRGRRLRRRVRRLVRGLAPAHLA